MNSSVRHDQDSLHEQLPSVFDHPLPKRTFSIPVSPQAATLRVGDELPPLQRPAWLDVPPGGHGPDSVHGDEYARRVLGTRGAIVLGSTVLGYVNEQLGRALGPSWLERGSLDVRFVSPVVRNDLVTARARVASIDADRVAFEVEVTNAAMDQQTSIVGTARYQF
jgi:hypothetical protein